MNIVVFATDIFVCALRSTDALVYAKPNRYMDGVARAGVIATTFWGVIGFWSALSPLFNWPWDQVKGRAYAALA